MGRSLSTWSPPWLWLSPALPSTVFNGSFLAKRSHVQRCFWTSYHPSTTPTGLPVPPKIRFFLFTPTRSKAEDILFHDVIPDTPPQASVRKPPAPKSQGHPLSRRHPDKKGSRAGPQIQVEDTTPPDPPPRAPRKNKGAFPALHEGAYPNPVFDLTNVWRPVLPFRQVLAQIRPVPSSTLFPPRRGGRI